MNSKMPPIPSWTSALVAVLIGFGGTVALVVQAMRTLGASVEQTGSAVTALCLAMGVTGIVASMRTRMPVVLAWSTPGAALLGASTAGLSWPVAIGVFIAAASMMILVGLIPVLGRLAERMPSGIASAMLAGVLLPFSLELFRLGAVDPLLVGLLVVVYVAARQRVPLYALLLVLTSGMLLTLVRGDIADVPAGATFGALLPVMPVFDLRAIVSVGVPLFLVTLVSQNLPGLVVLRSAGYQPQAGPLLLGTGFASLLVAPFGAHAVNLAAIVAALCTNKDAHPDHNKRWVVGVLYGTFYLVLALFSPVLVRVFVALPHSTIAALTGVALIPSIIGAIEQMLGDVEARDPAIITFLATASGLALFGLGAALWGLTAGFVALGIKTLLRR
ncbi:MAG TPA: benzoate/H(+) symporter BenE family transporter [Gemmatimonas sp.]|uniref:benzoate/H(+) symporter BenE family transporter n=1 Tax=Gemmatimonas sp. TaxID=1962908 RepID=UPI002ED8AD82